MKNFFLIIFCITVFLIQVSAMGTFFSEKRIPDLALAFAITLVLTLGFKESFWLILLAGILVDASSNVIFGTTTLAYFLMGWIISTLANIADIRSRKIFFLTIFALVVFISEIAKDFLFLLSLKIKADYFQESFEVPFYIFSADYFFKILYTILAAFVIYYVFRKASRALFLKPIKLAKKY